MFSEVSESEIKASSLKFVKERFGFINLKEAENSDIDLISHRISFEAGIVTFLKSQGFIKKGRKYVREIPDNI